MIKPKKEYARSSTKKTRSSLLAILAILLYSVGMIVLFSGCGDAMETIDVTLPSEKGISIVPDSSGSKESRISSENSDSSENFENEEKESSIPLEINTESSTEPSTEPSTESTSSSAIGSNVPALSSGNQSTIEISPITKTESFSTEPSVPVHATDSSEGSGEIPISSPVPTDGDVDLDLTRLSKTMVFSMLYNMMISPETYVGQRVRITGMAISEYDSIGDMMHYSILVFDEMACCQQGLEYRMPEGAQYPEDLSTVTLEGVYELYQYKEYSFYGLGKVVIK